MQLARSWPGPLSVFHHSVALHRRVECFSVAYVHWHWIGFTAAFNDNVILFSIFDRRVACMGPIYSAFSFNVIVVEIKSRLIDITSL